MKKVPDFIRNLCGLDGTRTRLVINDEMTRQHSNQLNRYPKYFLLN